MLTTAYTIVATVQEHRPARTSSMELVTAELPMLALILVRKLRPEKGRIIQRSAVRRHCSSNSGTRPQHILAHELPWSSPKGVISASTRHE